MIHRRWQVHSDTAGCGARFLPAE